MAKRLFIGALVAIALILVGTFDYVWGRQDLVDLARWFLGALLLATALFCWCLIQLAKMLRSSDRLRTMDFFFGVVFLIMPMSLGAMIWLVAAIEMLADLH